VVEESLLEREVEDVRQVLPQLLNAGEHSLSFGLDRVDLLALGVEVVEEVEDGSVDVNIYGFD